MNCTGKMVRIARGRLGILSMVKLKKKSLSRRSFRTHGRVIGNKNFFIFGLNYHKISHTHLISSAVYIFFVVRGLSQLPNSRFPSLNKCLKWS